MHGLQSSIHKMQADGGDERFWTAKQLLDKLFGNILSSPNESKFRKVNTANKVLARDLFSLQGARELLLQCGFEAWLDLAGDGSILVLPGTAPLSKLREVLKQLMDAAEASIRATREQEGGGASSLVFKCKGCAQMIDQRRHGGRNKWADEKLGAFRYRCVTCDGPDYSLCEECYDSLRNPAGVSDLAPF